MEPQARELLEQSRHAHEPTSADRARVRRKLALRVGASAALGGGVAKASVVATSTILKIAVPLVALAALGGFLLRQSGGQVQTASHESSAAIAPSATVVATPAETAALVPSVTVTAAPPAPPKVTPPTIARHTSTPASSADLEAETRLLAEAQAAIQRGDFTTALGKLDEYEKSFPSGVLTEERIAARVVALCGAGRKSDAQTLGQTFLVRYPRSPLAPRVRGSCAVQP